jgi:hypothetical protein
MEVGSRIFQRQGENKLRDTTEFGLKSYATMKRGRSSMHYSKTKTCSFAFRREQTFKYSMANLVRNAATCIAYFY